MHKLEPSNSNYEGKRVKQFKYPQNSLVSLVKDILLLGVKF